MNKGLVGQRTHRGGTKKSDERRRKSGYKRRRRKGKKKTQLSREKEKSKDLNTCFHRDMSRAQRCQNQFLLGYFLFFLILFFSTCVCIEELDL
jgi:hypothetical protein